MGLRTRICLLLVLLMAVFRPCAAQETEAPADRVRIVLTDGSELEGTVVSEDDALVVLLSEAGVRMEIPRDRIRTITVLKEPPGRFRRSDPNQTRLLFAPTARGVGAGQGYFAVYEVFFPFVAYGATDFVTLAGGVSLLPGSPEQLLYAAPKVTLYHRKQVAVAVGTFVATLTGESGAGGLVYGIGTFGKPHAAFTAGIGFAFGGGEFEETPVLLLGGEVQLSNYVAFVTENYVVPGVENGVVFSGGLRFFGERLAADFGFFTTPDAFGEGGVPALPWITISYHFGR